MLQGVIPRDDHPGHRVSTDQHGYILDPIPTLAENQPTTKRGQQPGVARNSPQDNGRLDGQRQVGSDGSILERSELLECVRLRERVSASVLDSGWHWLGHEL